MGSELKDLNMKDSETALQKVALDMGIKPEDLKAAESMANDCITRGDRYLKMNMPNEAVEEFYRVFMLRPYDKHILIRLAKSYFLQWKATKDIDRFKQADKMAKLCLLIDPNFEPAFALRKKLSQKDSYSPNRRLWAISGVVVLLLLLVLFLSSSKEPTAQLDKVAQTEPVKEEKRAAPPAKSPIQIEQPSTPKVAASGEHITIEDIPIEWGSGALNEWKIESETSKLLTYPSSGRWVLSYTHYGILVNESNIEVGEIKAKISLIDAEGKVFFTKESDFRSLLAPILRPNDKGLSSIHLYTYLTEAPTEKSVAKVRIDVVEAETSLALDTYKPSVVTPYEMSQSPSPGISFELRVRTFKFTSSQYGSSEAQVTFEVLNTGRRNIKSLELRVDFKSASGALVKSEESSPVMNIFTPLKPNESRIMRSTAMFFKGEVNSFDFTVVEID